MQIAEHLCRELQFFLGHVEIEHVLKGRQNFSVLKHQEVPLAMPVAGYAVGLRIFPSALPALEC